MQVLDKSVGAAQSTTERLMVSEHSLCLRSRAPWVLSARTSSSSSGPDPVNKDQGISASFGDIHV